MIKLMAKIKFREIIIEVVLTKTSKIKAFVKNVDELSPEEVIRMNENLEMLIDVYKPEPGVFGMPITNAMAVWLANGFGEEAKIIEYDKVKQDPGKVY
jgi:hypothetical protein